MSTNNIDNKEPSLTTFQSWLGANGVTVSDGVDVAPMPDGSGWRILATKDISTGTVLCATPKSLILSRRTSSLPYKEDDNSILHLAACLLHELRLGEESKWHGYLQFLPRKTVLVPGLWEDKALAGEDGREGLKWLAGTEAETHLDRKRDEGLTLDHLRRYYDKLVQESTNEHPNLSPFEALVYTYSLVSTRAFVIDAYHGIGIIPFCDMFNHSSDAQTSLLCDLCVCPECGKLVECEHDKQPVERIAHLTPDYLSMVEKEGSMDQADMRAEKDIQAGEEIFSCYEAGAGDPKLLVEWGFIERATLGEGMSWPVRAILDDLTAPAFMTVMERNQIEPIVYADSSSSPFRFVGPNASEIGSFYISPSGEISLNFFIALYLRVDELAESIEDAEARIIASIRTLQNGTSITGDPTLRTTTQTIVALLKGRLAGVHQPDTSSEALEQLKEQLSLKENPLQRTALSLAIDTRSSLLTCKARWQSVIDRV